MKFPIHSKVANGFQILIDHISIEKDRVSLIIRDTTEKRIYGQYSFDMPIDEFNQVFQYLLDKTHEYIQEEKEKKKTLREKVEDLLKQGDKEYLHYVSKDKLRGILNSTEKDE